MGFLNTVTKMLGDGILNLNKNSVVGNGGINVLMLPFLDTVCLSEMLSMQKASQATKKRSHVLYCILQETWPCSPYFEMSSYNLCPGFCSMIASSFHAESRLLTYFIM